MTAMTNKPQRVVIIFSVLNAVVSSCFMKMNSLFLYEEENIWWRFDDCFMVTGVVELVYLTSIYFTFPNNCCNYGEEHHLAVRYGTLWIG